MRIYENQAECSHLLVLRPQVGGLFISVFYNATPLSYDYTYVSPASVIFVLCNHLLGTKDRNRKFKPGFNLYMRIQAKHTNIVISSEHLLLLLLLLLLLF